MYPCHKIELFQVYAKVAGLDLMVGLNPALRDRPNIAPQCFREAWQSGRMHRS